jgi:hypothetical protein
VLSVWHGYAGQLTLTAAGLAHDHGQTPQVADHAGMHEHLTHALNALERIAPLTGRPDLTIWIWRVADLARLADEMASA